MKMGTGIKALAAGAALAVCAVPAPAEQGEVTGAFGYEFGQTVDPSALKQLGIEEKGGVRYSFIPANPYAPLTEYELGLTPHSLRIYRVTARGTFTSMQRCREELVRLEQALERKYVKTSGKVTTTFGERPVIAFGLTARKIAGDCTGAVLKKTLTLSYIDEDLRREAREEAGAAAADGSGAATGAADRDESGL